MDFMHDVLLTGAKVRVFTLVDVWRRECVALRVASTFSGSDVAAILAEVQRERGALPAVIQCDNGTELTSTAITGPTGTRCSSISAGRVNSSTIPSAKPSTAPYGVSVYRNIGLLRLRKQRPY